MDELKKIFTSAYFLRGLDWSDKDEYIRRKMQETDYTLSDIVNFVQERLDDPYESAYAGSILSMLINTKITEHDKVTLKTSPEEYGAMNGKEHMSCLGYGLRAGELTIIGDAGNSTGMEQMGGTLKIKGNTVQMLCANKRGGRTIVEGKTVYSACEGMTGGVTRVFGNTFYHTCDRMTGGMLIVGGEIEGMGNMEGGILVYKNKVIRMDLEGWDARTIAPIDRELPEELAGKILDEYAEKEGFKDIDKMVENKGLAYRARLRNLDQELPIIIRKIGEPERKLQALKVLEQEALENPKREIIGLAVKCGANTGEAMEKYNKKIRGDMMHHKEKMRELRKKLFY